ncbi:MAG: tRNA (N6-isopentenyl adenosine(37)-C2)-methylthiotransferase MiaB [Candidatus Aminicenantales bacterium]
MDSLKNAKKFDKLRYYIHTFGCQMNENDSERVAGLLSRAGAGKANSLEESDIIVVNTCAVRQKSEEKLYSLLGRLARLKKKKEVVIGVIGCVAQLRKSEIMEKNPAVDFVIGPDNYDHISHKILEHSGEKLVSTGWTSEWKEISSEMTLRESAVSAYVTIMEGCDNFCAYCVVPYTRGREKFRPLENILFEVKELASRGYKEIQLLGQNVNSYLDPVTKKNFPALLREVDRIEGIEWIRFITTHPKNLTPDIAEAMKEGEKICHQLHLPLQSGSSAVLKRMNRGYTREEYLEKIAFLRRLMPDISLSTDIIVGFPGETEEEFKDTLRILEEVRFTNIFSFRYSPRPMTKASYLKDDIPFEVKKRRLIEVQSLQREIQLEMNRRAKGKVMKVLCTGRSKKDPEIFAGRNEGFQVINFTSEEDGRGEFVDVLITSCGPYSLRGKRIRPS